MVDSFAFSLFRHLPAEGNLAVSPLSVEAALRVARLGARAAARAELDRILDVGSFPPSVDASAPVGLLPASTEVEIGTFNAVFGREGLRFREEFVSEAAGRYGVQCANLDFERGSGAATINDWVSRATRGRIPRVVSPEELRQTVVLLANAVYFKASWASPFREEQTRPGDFTLASGDKVQVALMRQTLSLSTWRDDALSVVELEYVGREYTLDVMIPARHDGLPELERQLGAASFGEWLSRLQVQRVTLELPRFKRDAGRGVSMGAALRRMGLVRALTPEADFSGMAAEPAYISDVMQTVFFEVDEAGTEAAAATAIPMPRSAPPKLISIAHPFLFLLRHRPTGAILFIGRIVDPTKTE